MFYAKNKSGKRVFADDAAMSPPDEFSCPVCGGAVRLRQGDIKVPHFAHVDRGDCDSFGADMSEWHLAWQKEFPEECREVVLTADGESHRADVLYHGVVVEFQHSPMDLSEFWARNDFYTKAAKHLVWVFDMREKVWAKHIETAKIDPEISYTQYKWKWPSRTFDGFLPHKTPNISLVFELSVEDDDAGEDETYLAHVTWASPEPAFSRFICQDRNFDDSQPDLAEWIDGVLLPKLSGAPHCPRCGAKMVLRRKRVDGASFWGCSNFPNCRTCLPVVPVS